jgi:hypothetical protein
LEVINIAYSDLCVLFLRFKFELYLEDDNFWVVEVFGHLLETSVGECLFEGDT